MTELTPPAPTTPANIAADERPMDWARRALQVAGVKPAAPSDLPALSQLLEQAAALSEPTAADPIRTVHHLACTGGTLISRCIAAMPNIRLLSETDPLSTINKHPFAPSDLVGLVRHGSRSAEQSELADLFFAGFEKLRAQSQATGHYLVLREHNHSLFHTGNSIARRPGLLDLVSEHLSPLVNNGAPTARILSLVTVRHPIESYQSVVLNKWHRQFKPSTLEEYARRYHAFLDRHDALPMLRYESFVADPSTTMKSVCGILELPFNPDFQNLSQHIKLSGDSGRSGNVIAARPARVLEPALRQEMTDSPAYIALCERLDYPTRMDVEQL